MARKVKVGLEYFPIDTDCFSDLKVRKLIKYQGGQSISVYVHLLCIIYNEGYYIKWDNELPFIISEVTGYKEAYINEVFNCCIQVGLFSKEMLETHQVVTSKGIQERYKVICKLLNRKSGVSKFSLIDSEETVINSEKMGISSEGTTVNSELSTQKKRKEKKGKESEYNPAENFNKQGMIHRSNLYRKPNVPEFDKVHECFVARGGTKEMAEAFFRKHSAVEWYLNGTPIMNFVHLVPSFIDNWRRNEVKGNKNQENKDQNERLAELRKQQEDEAWAAIAGNNASK